MSKKKKNKRSKKVVNKIPVNLPGTSLKIVGQGKKNLTKKQKLFNKLTSMIERLENDIAGEKDKMVRLLTFHANKIQPLQIENANLEIKLAMVLADSEKKYKFSKNQKLIIREVIIDLCDKAFSDIVPNQEQEDFYNQWSGTSYKEEVKQQEEEAKKTVSELINSIYGTEIDLNEFDSSPEGFVRFQKKLEAEYEKVMEKEKNETDRKKTKKQLQQEEEIKAAEELKNKSIRSIYITLAKLLHPDAETDPVLRSEKEEIMKKVTKAYEEKDFSTLLKLELEWVYKETSHLEKLSDDKLKIYITALREQIIELEREKIAIGMNPMFEEVEDFAGVPEKIAIRHMKSEIKELNEIKKDLLSIINEYISDKKKIVEFIMDYFDEMESSEMYDDLFDLYL